MLRCRCKRKATEHACAPPFKSTKPPLAGVICTGFDSPWVCNCGCDWRNHEQRWEEIQVSKSLMPFPEVAMFDEGALDALGHGLKRGGIMQEMEAAAAAASEAVVDSGVEELEHGGVGGGRGDGDEYHPDAWSHPRRAPPPPQALQLHQQQRQGPRVQYAEGTKGMHARDVARVPVVADDGTAVAVAVTLPGQRASPTMAGESCVARAAGATAQAVQERRMPGLAKARDSLRLLKSKRLGEGGALGDGGP